MRKTRSVRVYDFRHVFIVAIYVFTSCNRANNNLSYELFYEIHDMKIKDTLARSPCNSVIGNFRKFQPKAWHI